MKFMTVSDSRTNYARTLDQVVDDREEVVITRDKGDVVLVAREEYESLLETLHLLSTPANAAALERSFTQAARGRLSHHGLDD